MKDGDTWKCAYYAPKTIDINPRQQCKDRLRPRFGIDRVLVDGGSAHDIHRATSASCSQTGNATLRIEGTNVALADRLEFSRAGISAVRRQWHPASTCQGTGCVEYLLNVSPGMANGSVHVSLGLWGLTDKRFDLKVESAIVASCPGGPKYAKKTSGAASTSSSSGGMVATAHPSPGPAVSPRASAHKRCGPSGLAYSASPATFTLTADTLVRISNSLATFGCDTSSAASTTNVNTTTNGKFFIRGVDEWGLGTAIEFTATQVWLPAGSYRLYLQEGQTPVGDYALYW